jgi:hypothetical protein
MYIERILIVLGEQNSGKSKQIRGMLDNQRFGYDGDFPETGKTATSFALSSNRRLYVRLTSPHEWEESFDQMSSKIIEEASRFPPNTRWNAIIPMQISASRKLPGGLSLIDNILVELNPERIRYVVLNPIHDGTYLDSDLMDEIYGHIMDKERVDYCSIDARHELKNGTILLDYFDFA